MNEMRRDPVTRKWVIMDKSKPPEEMVKALRHAVLREAKKRKNFLRFLSGERSLYSFQRYGIG